MKKFIQIPFQFTEGLNSKADSKISNGFVKLENCHYDKAGSLSKRKGYRALTKNTISGATDLTPFTGSTHEHIFSLDEHLLTMTEDGIWEYSAENDKWHFLNKNTNWDIKINDIARDNEQYHGPQISYMTDNNGNTFVLTVWQKIGGGIFYSIKDKTTGRVAIHKRQLDSEWGDGESPLIVINDYTDTTFIFWSSENAIASKDSRGIKRAAIAHNNPYVLSATNGLEITTVVSDMMSGSRNSSNTNAGGNVRSIGEFDICAWDAPASLGFESGTMFGVYNKRDLLSVSGQSYSRFIRLNPDGLFQSGSVDLAFQGPKLVKLNGIPGQNVLHLVGRRYVGSEVFHAGFTGFFEGLWGNYMLDERAWGNDFGVPQSFNSYLGYQHYTGSKGYIFVEYQSGGWNNDFKLPHLASVHSVEVDVTTGFTGSYTSLLGCTLAAQPFVHNNEIYCVTGFDSDVQGQLVLRNRSGSIVGNITPGEAGISSTFYSGVVEVYAPLGTNIYTDIICTNRLPNVLNIDDSFVFPFVRKGIFQVSDGDVSVSRGISEAIICTNETNIYSTDNLAQSSLLSGMIINQYDGVNVFESGFLNYPEEPKITAQGSGLIPAGTYSFCATFAHVDNNGRLIRSAPSRPVTVTSSGASNFQIDYDNCHITNKENVRIELWRTEKDGTLAYLISPGSEPIINDRTSLRGSFVDRKTDAVLIGNEPLYGGTLGGTEVVNIAPPPSSIIKQHNNRIFLVHRDRPGEIWFSKREARDLGINFSDELVIRVPERGGKITALESLSLPTDSVEANALVIFKENNIFVTTGDGPEATGGGNQYKEPNLIPSDVGCIDKRSVVLTPMGVFFKSNKGIYLLDRSLNTSYVGAQVEEFNDLTITSAILSSDTNRVMFFTFEGTVMVFDFFFQKWTTYSDLPSSATGIWRGEVAFGHADTGAIYVPQTSSNLMYRDDDVHASGYNMKVQTPWLSFNGIQNQQTVRFLHVLGTFKADHTFKVDFDYDFSEQHTQTITGSVGEFVNTYVSGSDVYQYRIRLPKQRCQSIRVSLQDTSTGSLNESMSFEHLNFEVGVIEQEGVQLATQKKRGN